MEVHRSDCGAGARVREGDLRTALNTLLDRPGGRRPKVMLIGNYGNGNAGDDGILVEVDSILSRMADVTVM
jgi:hypothetical protein